MSSKIFFILLGGMVFFPLTLDHPQIALKRVHDFVAVIVNRCCAPSFESSDIESIVAATFAGCFNGLPFSEIIN
jgi:hypothetical protein